MVKVRDAGVRDEWPMAALHFPLVGTEALASKAELCPGTAHHPLALLQHSVGWHDWLQSV